MKFIALLKSDNFIAPPTSDTTDAVTLLARMDTAHSSGLVKFNISTPNLVRSSSGIDAPHSRFARCAERCTLHRSIVVSRRLRSVFGEPCCLVIVFCCILSIPLWYLLDNFWHYIDQDWTPVAPPSLSLAVAVFFASC